ncbi:hypothetical protein ACFL1H_04075 [Nanoarchaeota archaeon]
MAIVTMHPGEGIIQGKCLKKIVEKIYNNIPENAYHKKLDISEDSDYYVKSMMDIEEMIEEDEDKSGLYYGEEKQALIDNVELILSTRKEDLRSHNFRRKSAKFFGYFLYPAIMVGSNIYHRYTSDTLTYQNLMINLGSFPIISLILGKLFVRFSGSYKSQVEALQYTIRMEKIKKDLKKY